MARRLGEVDQIRRTSGGDAATRTGSTHAAGAYARTATASGAAALAIGALIPGAESGRAVGADEQQSRWTALMPGPWEQHACFAAGDSIKHVDRQTTSHERA